MKALGARASSGMTAPSFDAALFARVARRAALIGLACPAGRVASREARSSDPPRCDPSFALAPHLVHIRRPGRSRSYVPRRPGQCVLEARLDLRREQVGYRTHPWRAGRRDTRRWRRCDPDTLPLRSATTCLPRNTPWYRCRPASRRVVPHRARLELPGATHHLEQVAAETARDAIEAARQARARWCCATAWRTS
jgi:hypothetical protein